MARRGRLAWWDALDTGLLMLVLAALAAHPAQATLKYGAVELSGSLETQNLVRVPDGNQYQFIQNRNTFRFRVDWNWFARGKLIDRFEIPFIRQSKFYLLYRGVYDGFYDLGPNDNQRGVTKFDDLVGGAIEGNRVGTLRNDCDPRVENCLREGNYSRTDVSRNDYKRKNELREVYVDFSLKDLPVSFRVGRQQVVWGESDQFRMMDIWNPIDLRWHLQQEPFTEIREPLWMIKGLWDISRIPVPVLDKLTNTFFEVVWNPFDYQPGIRPDFLPRPWAAPYPSPVRAGQVQVVSPDLRGLVSPEFNLNGTGFQIGDFEKNPGQASGIGARFHGVTPQGLEFTTNYLYHRGRGIGAAASNAFALKIKEVRTDLQSTTTIRKADGQVTGARSRCNKAEGCEIQNLVGTFDGAGNYQPAYFGDIGTQVFRGFVDAEFVHPYVHIFGLTANYFEGDFTQAVFRLETAYALGIPYISAKLPIRDANGQYIVSTGDRPPILVAGSQDLKFAPGMTKRDVWAGMIGFDRPTWIRWLNKKSTWFLTGQFFFSYVNGATPWLRGSNITASESPYFSPTDSNIFPSGLIENNGMGQWLSGPHAGVNERVQNSSFTGVNSDTVHRWETLLTFAGFSFYRGGSIMPFAALAFDPVNMSLLAQPHIQYFYTNNFIVRVGGKFYTNFHRGPTLDPWGAGGLNARRDEAEVRFTLQF